MFKDGYVIHMKSGSHKQFKVLLYLGVFYVYALQLPDIFEHVNACRWCLIEEQQAYALPLGKRDFSSNFRENQLQLFIGA